MKQIFIILSLLVFFQSCVTDGSSIESPLQNNSDIVLQPRSEKLPEATNRPFVNESSRSIGPNGEQIVNSRAYLGYSYTVGNSIIGDPENIKYQVIDIEKVFENDPSSISAVRLAKSSEDSYAYDSMDSFGEVVSKKIVKESGFSVHISKFKLGRKKTVTRLFKDSLTSTEKSVMGELNIMLANNSFKLLMGKNNIKKYSESCLSKSFIENLYSSTIKNVSSYYGEFLLSGYTTGGKATALFAGLHKDSTSLKSKTEDMTRDMNASFSWNNDSVKGNLIFGTTNGSKKEFSGNLTQTQIHLNTYGGNLADQIIASTVKLDELSIDLTHWWRSLADHDTHTMVDIPDEGLLPLYSIILEKNFKQRMKDTDEGFLYGYNNVLTPYVEIVRVFARYSSGQPLYEIAPVLNTRNGDKIVLSDGNYLTDTDENLKQNMDNAIYDIKVQEIFNKFKRYFTNLKFVKNYTTIYDPNVRSPLCMRLDKFDGDNLKRHVEDNGMVYLYNRNGKFALSYYSDDGLEDKTMDDYGMWDWYDIIPDETNRKISMSTLSGYTLIGL